MTSSNAADSEARQLAAVSSLPLNKIVGSNERPLSGSGLDRLYVRDWAFADVLKRSLARMALLVVSGRSGVCGGMEWTAPRHAAIFEWHQQGRIWLSRYEPPLPSLLGWHFVADPAGTESLLQLLGLIEETMLPVERSIKLQPKLASDYHPIDASKLKRHAIVSPSALKISVDLEDEVDWSMDKEPNCLTLRLNKAGLNKLKAGVVRYKENQASSWPGDYTIGSYEQRAGENIFFW